MNAEQLKHERFEELCALAAIGDLSASEFAELNEHLPSCDPCRELYADFCRMASRDMGAVAAERRYGDDIGVVDEAALLEGVLARAHEQKTVTQKVPLDPEKGKPRFFGFHFHSPSSSLWIRSAGLAACFAVIALAGYRYGFRQRPTIPVALVASPANPVETTAPTPQPKASEEEERLQSVRAQRDSLQSALAEARVQYSALLDQQKTLLGEIAAAQQQAQRNADDLQNSKLKSEQSEAQIRDLQSKLQDAIANGETQALALNELKDKLRKVEEETSLATASGDKDADAKNLFGARDLHIVDVYDVDGSGKTKRTFGRVYYAEKKLLLFYAFDLQAKQNARRTAGFQAWGYRQGDDDKPRNLGLFLMDDPAISRWVLKVNDARVLERVDAVFVTLEPPNGSPTPSGRRLLYANLGGPPNHP
jgi:hypothetical protein